ncbi:unnamed protein product [Cylindrotheca closterium]|uniref:Thioredoxin domain-containing protein n=1 Tax=Cylindrotheca closterium TaxID=2856 RepID=A0AAD2G164_9STRA|nr:unnamed protein product [Cylindrotheca closterium]
MMFTSSSNLVSLLLCILSFSRLFLGAYALNPEQIPASRRNFLRTIAATTATAASISSAALLLPTDSAQAAPPIAVIAEELGYFPVQNRNGDLVYVPKKVQRQSTDQAIELAKMLTEKGMVFYGAFWCPHCSRQKEIFGAQAFSLLNYQECAPKGYGFKGVCKDIDGYPSFRSKGGMLRKTIDFSGERPLSYFAEQVGFASFDPSLEGEVPMVGTACKLPQRQ